MLFALQADYARTAHDHQTGKSMSVFSIGNAKVDFDALVIDGDTGHYSVEPKVLDVLQAMMERKGEVIDRETLIDEVWGGVFWRR